MYRIAWDPATGGVILSSNSSTDTLGTSPRPVFWEELDLLRLAETGWTYPHCPEPLMWAVNKQYFYRGQLLFEAKGANIYDAPAVVLRDGVGPMELVPVDVAETLRRNADPMFLLESEAIAFIRDTYTAYSGVNRTREAAKANQLDFDAIAEKAEKRTKKKMAVVRQDCDSFDVVPLDVAREEGRRVILSTRIDRFIASFSGGKDSQVVLDLVTRAIPPTDFEVIYSDTGYELPTSLELYEEVKRFYGQRFPALKFSTTRNHESVLNYWDKIGTPSDTHRWCCSVMKTAPLYRSLKVDGNKQARVLTFDGVRAEESTRRSGYDRIGKGKHINVFNAHPILDWNNVEIFLYLFKHDLKINEAYRLGKARVGCIICPFSTQWDDCIINHAYPEELKPFIDRIKRYSASTSIKDIDQFITERKWKIKNLGEIKDLPIIKSNLSPDRFQAEIIKAKQSIFTWLPALCDYTVSKKGDSYSGHLKFKDAIYPFSVKENRETGACKLEISNFSDTSKILLMKRILQKTAHCIHCELCEVDCPTGALSIENKVNIDKSKCIHCHRCITSHDKGCVVADCNRMVKDSDTSLKVYAYKKFGLREEWLDDFMSEPDSFWTSETWGEPMYDAFNRWAKDALIIVTKHKLTNLGESLRELYNNNPTLVWEIIWINLSYSSFIVNRLCRYYNFGKPYNANLLKEELFEAENISSSSTLAGAAIAICDMMAKSPVGEELLQGVSDGKQRVRKGYDGLSPEALAYSIYKYAEAHEVNEMRVSDFYSPDVEDGPYKQFGISKSALIKGLRFLSNEADRVLIAELNMGLEHITLTGKHSLEELVKRFNS